VADLICLRAQGIGALSFANEMGKMKDEMKVR
jgi:hypothetical protein